MLVLVCVCVGGGQGRELFQENEMEGQEVFSAAGNGRFGPLNMDSFLHTT